MPPFALSASWNAFPLLPRVGGLQVALARRQGTCSRVACLAVVATLCSAAPARADRGALSLDVGAGAAGLDLAAPYTLGEGTTVGVGFEAMVGLRYAVINELEFTVAAYFEPSVGYTHDDVTVVTSSGDFPGTVTNSLHLFGVVGGVRYVNGAVWKLVAGLEVGWCHRAYTGLQFNGMTSFALPNFPTDNLVLQPLLGVEWAFADHWSASLLPRFTILVGPDPTLGASVLLTISYSWFL